MPLINDFMPCSRSGDAADLATNEIAAEDGGKRQYYCRQAGERIVQAFGTDPRAKMLEDYLDPAIAIAIRRLFDACVDHRLPIYTIIPTVDRDSVPVTLEQLYLPFSNDRTTPTHVLTSFHAFSTEGRFELNGLARQNSDLAPYHWAVVIDPQATLVPALKADAHGLIELDFA